MTDRPVPASAFGGLAPLGAVAAAMVSITVGASIAKTLFPVIGAAGTTALRLAIGAVLLAGAFRVWRVRLDRRTLAAAFPYGLALGAMNLLFYLSIQRLPLGVALAIEFTGPLALAVLLSRRRADLGWIALAVLGLSFLLPLGTAATAADPVGVGFAFAAGLCWAAYILTGKRAGEALGAPAPALGMIVAAALVLPFGIAEAGSALLDPAVLTVALAVALLSSAIPYSLEMFALRRLPASSFGILTSGEPAIGAVVGVLFLKETLPPSTWLGIAAIVAASIGTTRASARRLDKTGSTP